MHSIAFFIGNKAIHWYGIMTALGFVASVLVMMRIRKRADLSSDQIFDIAMLALFSGIVGARLFYVVEFWQKDFAHASFFKIFRIDEGGLVFYGGFILALISVSVYAVVKKRSIPRILDIFAPAMALGHAFGRIGCFLQGCCFGKPYDGIASVVFPEKTFPAIRYPAFDSLNSCPLHPVQLYESGANLILCAVLLILFGRFKKGGQIAAVYLMAYACLRFSLEFFRGDHTDFFLGLTPSQTIALFLMFPLGLGLFIYWSRRKETFNAV